MNNTYDELERLFLDDGYKITYNNISGIEAHGKNGLIFSTMKEDEYFEATVYLADNEAVVGYDILLAEYDVDIFVDSVESKEKVSQWRNILSIEVERLNLVKYNKLDVCKHR